MRSNMHRLLGALAIAGAFLVSCVRPEALDTTIHYVSSDELPSFGVQAVNDRMRALAADYPVGGIAFFAHNIKDPEQLTAFQKELRALPGKPLLSIDEEGGRVARLAKNPAFGLPQFESMTALGTPRAAGKAADTIGTYLRKYGFDIDFAPVADVNTNPENIVIGTRAFSFDPKVAAKCVAAYVKGMRKAGILSCIKHFPGHGDTRADTHFGYAVSGKNWEELASCEMVPFKAGIAAGAPLVMTAHIAVPAVTGTELPSTLSSVVLQDKLRGELGFKGVIISDAMEMGAIARQFPVPEACVLALEAGVDVLLCVKDYPACFNAVLDAIGQGRLTEARIDETTFRRIQRKVKKLAKFFASSKKCRIFAIPFDTGVHYSTAEIAQLVEHDLAKVGVASSSLVFRSKRLVAMRGVFVVVNTPSPTKSPAAGS